MPRNFGTIRNMDLPGGSAKLKDIPQFIDVMTGTGNVASSVITYGMSRPVLNDYDPLQICFARAIEYRKSQIIKYHHLGIPV